jgi:tRNA threonylcarbamoyladenosine biosynthesis protein TsaB
MLLAIDSATSKIGIALYDGVEVLHEAVWQSVNRHSVELTPAIDQALRRGSFTIKDVEVIGLAIGPGSYTGLRIGAAVAKGLALSRHIPLVGVSTFDILAAAIPPDPERKLAVALSAGRGRLSIGWYKTIGGAWQMSGEASLFTPEELSQQLTQPTLVCGELDESTQRLLGRKRVNVSLVPPALSLRRPAFLAELAWARWQAGQTDDPSKLAPVYLQTGDNIPE